MTTLAPKLTAAQKVYRVLSMDDKYSNVRWIAGVLLDCGRPASRMKALKALVDDGREVGPLAFVMPYEGLRVDGKALATLPLLDQGQEVSYNLSWEKPNHGRLH